MFRPVAALVLSAALALPGTQARADIDGRQAAQILGGLAALYVLKEALDRRDDRRDARPAPVQRHQIYRPHQPRHQVQRPHHDGGNRFNQGWPHGNARVVPARCERIFQGPRGTGIGYGARCMRNSVARPGLLPHACLRQIQTPRGWREVYPRDCLQRAGWQVSARRY